MNVVREGASLSVAFALPHRLRGSRQTRELSPGVVVYVPVGIGSLIASGSWVGLSSRGSERALGPRLRAATGVPLTAQGCNELSLSGIPRRDEAVWDRRGCGFIGETRSGLFRFWRAGLATPL